MDPHSVKKRKRKRDAANTEDLQAGYSAVPPPAVFIASAGGGASAEPVKRKHKSTHKQGLAVVAAPATSNIVESGKVKSRKKHKHAPAAAKSADQEHAPHSQMGNGGADRPGPVAQPVAEHGREQDLSGNATKQSKKVLLNTQQPAEPVISSPPGKHEDGSVKRHTNHLGEADLNSASQQAAQKGSKKHKQPKVAVVPVTASGQLAEEKSGTLPAPDQPPAQAKKQKKKRKHEQDLSAVETQPDQPLHRPQEKKQQLEAPAAELPTSAPIAPPLMIPTQVKLRQAQPSADTIEPNGSPAGREKGEKKKKKKKTALVSGVDASAAPAIHEELELELAEAGPAATSAFAPTAAVPAGPQPADQPQNGKPSAEGIQAQRKPPVGRSGSGQARAFQRVNAEEWLGQKGSWDNSYAASFGSTGWGAKAQERLGQVRGKDFRHEKTKKKRGTYRGGAIDGGVRSFKFESDTE